MLSNHIKIIQHSNIYHKKKEKQVDHLIRLVDKIKNSQENLYVNQDQEYRDMMKEKILKKRIDLILKNGTNHPKVSQPVPYVKRKWISPLQKMNQKDDITAFKPQIITQKPVLLNQKEQAKHVLKILDINKKLKYFGEYLHVEYQGQQKVQIAHLSNNDSKITYLMKKFAQLQKQIKPKLYIINYKVDQQGPFINYLEKDEFYQNIMRKNDNQLMKMLVTSLESNYKFTLTSYMKFYNIFVWQNATKEEQTQFVIKLLMSESKQKCIIQISKTIDLICKKICIQNFNKSLQNFNEVMKKLLFGEQYENSNKKEYLITRKALKQSLQINEECISIFINIFYTG